MSLKKEIIITECNRDGAKIWLEQIDDSNEYILNSNKDYVITFARILYDELNTDAIDYDFIWNFNERTVKAKCKAYDPSGGPYLSVGSKINEEYITNYLLENKED